MRWARPSTIAVLPTPGSPMSTGLFLVRRERTWMTRRISSSRPMTGSSLPCSAASVRSRPNFSSAWYCVLGALARSRGAGRGPRPPPARASPRSRRPRAARRRPWSWRSASASSRCSVETYSSLSLPIAFSAARSTPMSSFDAPAGSPASPLTVGRASSAALASARMAPGSAPSFCRTGTTTPASCSSRTASRCSGVSCGLRRLSASCCAAWRASWDLIVKRSACIFRA